RFGFSTKIPAPARCASVEMRENLNIRYLSFVRQCPIWGKNLYLARTSLLRIRLRFQNEKDPNRYCWSRELRQFARPRDKLLSRFVGQWHCCRPHASLDRIVPTG